MRVDFSQKYLRECFLYEQKTGRIFWKNRPRNHFISEKAWKIFNKLYAGKNAGSPHPDTGHIYISLGGSLYAAHRLIWKLVTGVTPKVAIDHINCRGEDNRWKNLREADRSQNQINSLPRGKVPFRGVIFKNNKWIARISYKGRRVYLGAFNSAEAASAAYLIRAKMLYGEFARAL